MHTIKNRVLPKGSGDVRTIQYSQILGRFCNFGLDHQNLKSKYTVHRVTKVSIIIKVANNQPFGTNATETA